MKVINISLKVNKGEKFFLETVEIDPEGLIEGPVFWDSTTPDIVIIDPKTKMVQAEKEGTGTLYATNADGQIIVFCTVVVECVDFLDTGVKANKSTNMNVQVLSRSYTSSCNNISAIGYSGRVFAYTKLGSNVELHAGARMKTGPQSYASSGFSSQLVYMNSIYASLNREQREAWYVLRAKGFASEIIGVLSGDVSTIVNIAYRLLNPAGINLGNLLQATALGMYNWYYAEQNALSYFDAF